jgi:hypothetical protein
VKETVIDSRLSESITANEEELLDEEDEVEPVEEPTAVEPVVLVDAAEESAVEVLPEETLSPGAIDSSDVIVPLTGARSRVWSSA